MDEATSNPRRIFLNLCSPHVGRSVGAVAWMVDRRMLVYSYTRGNRVVDMCVQSLCLQESWVSDSAGGGGGDVVKSLSTYRCMAWRPC